MANGFFPAMQLQGVDVGQFGRGLAQGQQLRAQNMQMQQAQQDQLNREVLGFALGADKIDSLEGLNMAVMNSNLSDAAKQQIGGFSSQIANLPPEQQAAAIQSQRARMIAQASPEAYMQMQRQQAQQNLRGTRVQSSVAVPGGGFQVIMDDGSARYVPFAETEQEAISEVNRRVADEKAEAAAKKERAVSGARAETLGKEKVEEGVAQSVTTRARGDIDAGLSAGAPLQRVNRMLELLDEGVKTGGWENVKLRTAQLFGIEGADEAELAYNMGKDVISQYRETFGAAFTKSEGDKLDRIEKSFGKSAAANRRLLKQLQNMYNARINKAIVKAKGSHKGSRLGTDDEVTELQGYLSGNFGGGAPASEETDEDIYARYNVKVD